MINPPSDLEDWLSTRIDEVDGCWEWRGAKSAGYGRLTFEQKNYAAHRFVFEIHHGREPVGFLLHSCDNPACFSRAA